MDDHDNTNNRVQTSNIMHQISIIEHRRQAHEAHTHTLEIKSTLRVRVGIEPHDSLYPPERDPQYTLCITG